MRLASFIRDNLETILQEWEDFAATLQSLASSNKVRLRDHAKAMLLVICADLETTQALQASIDKSHGKAPDEANDTPAEAHAVDRLQSGLSIEELMAEYRAVRASVLRLWQSKVKQADESDLQDMTRFNEAIDQSLTESIARYSTLLRESQNVFLAVLGHDVRNPLGAISMGSQLLMQDQHLHSKNVRIAQQINRSVARANELVSDLMDYSTTRLGTTIPLARAPMNFGVECTSIVDELRMFYPDSDIQLELEGELDAHWDRVRIGQAVSNLVANAIQHGTDDTAVWVTMSGLDDQISWTIQNYGEAISPAELRAMFDPGKRFAMRPAEDRHHAQNRHLGLGLYITRAIIEAHQGTIRVNSTEAEGTTFRVYLPRG